jgi:hypothetical protein
MGIDFVSPKKSGLDKKLKASGRRAMINPATRNLVINQNGIVFEIGLPGGEGMGFEGDIFALLGSVGVNSDLVLYTTKNGNLWNDYTLTTPNPGQAPYFPSCVYGAGALHIFHEQFAGAAYRLYQDYSTTKGRTFEGTNDVAGDVNASPWMVNAIITSSILFFTYLYELGVGHYAIDNYYSSDNGATWGTIIYGGFFALGDTNQPLYVLASHGDDITVLRQIDPPELYIGRPGNIALYHPPADILVTDVADPKPDFYIDADFDGSTILIAMYADDGDAHCYTYSVEGSYPDDNTTQVLGCTLIKSNACVICCGINRNHANKMYAVVQDTTDWETLYLCTSEDSGATWDYEDIGKGYWTSLMTMNESDYFFFIDAFDDDGIYHPGVYSSAFGGFKAIPQLDGEDHLLYQKTIAIRT